MPRRGNGEGETERLPSGKWRARRSKVVGGELVRESKTFSKRSEAQDWLRIHSQPSKAGTVDEWLDQWLEILTPDRAAKTVANLRYLSERWIRPTLGPLKLRGLDKLACSKWLAGLATQDDPASDSGRQKAGWVLRQAMKAAVELGQIPVSPMAGVKIKSPETEEKRAFTEEELRTVVEAGKTYGLSAVFCLWADAGLRPGEMYALEWADIDFKKGVVSITKSLDGYTHKVKSPKTKGSRRKIRLSAETVASLVDARPVEKKLVLPNAVGTWMWEENFRRMYWHPLRDKIGLQWATPYTFRHTMATILLRSGVQLPAVSKRLGHSSSATTLKHYAHAMPDDEERAAEEMGRVLKNL